jgi:hypothetical protein
MDITMLVIVVILLVAIVIDRLIARANRRAKSKRSYANTAGVT